MNHLSENIESQAGVLSASAGCGGSPFGGDVGDKHEQPKDDEPCEFPGEHELGQGRSERTGEEHALKEDEGNNRTRDMQVGLADEGGAVRLGNALAGVVLMW